MSYLLHNNEVLRVEIQIDDERTRIQAFLGSETVGTVALNRYPSEHFVFTELEPILEELDEGCGDDDLRDAEILCDEKDTTYYLEWLKIEKPYRNGGYGRLLLDTARFCVC